MKLFLILSILFLVPKAQGTQEIIVTDSVVHQASTTLGTIGERFDLIGEGEDFYQSLNLLPFVQANINSFINSDDSIRFAGQSSSQLLVLEDGIPQHSSTGIGGARSYHFMDPFFFDEVLVNINGASARKGAGAFSGAIDFKSSMKPVGKFLLSVGSFGQQKVGIKKVKEFRGGAFSIEALRSFKAGPSLKSQRADTTISINGPEDDSRELNIVRFKWKQNSANNLGYNFQLKYFNDNQDFDQFIFDDNRPFSEESLVEALIRHKSLIFNRAILSTDFKTNINNRTVLVANGDNTEKLSYNSKNIFGRLSVEVYDFFTLDNFTVGLEGTRDFSLSLSEVNRSSKNSFFQSSIFSSFIKKNEKRLLRAAFRIEQADDMFMVNYSIGQDFKGHDYIFSVGVAQSNRAPSFYELYSLYGSADLNAEKNLSLELNYKKVFNRFSLGMTGFFQKQENLILFDLVTSRYKNLGKNTYRGFGVSINTKVLNAEIELDVSFTDSLDQMALVDLSRLKASAQLSAPINSKTKIQWQQIFYGPKQDFNGQEVNSSIYSKMALQYKLMKDIRMDFLGSFNTEKNVLSDRLIQLNLVGAI